MVSKLIDRAAGVSSRPARDRSVARVLLVAVLAAALPGCGLFVAAGKMFWGDPLLPSHFTSRTNVRLTQVPGKVLVYCSAPHAITQILGSIELDLAEDTGREMKRRGVNILPGAEVAKYLQDSGGVWGKPDELARAFDDVQYVLHFDLERFDYKEENSPNLFRGRVSGMLYAYEMVELGEGTRAARPCFQQEFTSVYPQHAPVGVETMSARVFTSKLKKQIGKQLAQVFVDYRASEIVD
jgi:hypothetical protein